MTTPANPMVQMFSKDGDLGDIPYTHMHDALQNGFKMAVHMNLNGESGYVPADRVQDAAKAGGKVIPFDLSAPPSGFDEAAKAMNYGMGEFANPNHPAHGMLREGYQDIAAGEYQSGAHKLISGALEFLKPGIPAAGGAPLRAVAAGALGYVGSKVGESVGPEIGLTPELGSDIGGLAGASLSATPEEGIGALRDRLGRMMRDPQTNQLNLGTKAVSSLFKLFGGPEITEALVPDHPQAVQNMEYEQRAQDFMRRQRQQDVLDRAQARQEAAGRKATIVSKKPIGPAEEQPQFPAPKATQPLKGGGEGRPATWTNETVRTLAGWGDPDALDQARARGMTDIVQKYSTAQITPRSVTRFDAVGNPLP